MFDMTLKVKKNRCMIDRKHMAISKSTLKAHIDNNLTAQQIAVAEGQHVQSVYRWLRKHGLRITANPNARPNKLTVESKSQIMDMLLRERKTVPYIAAKLDISSTSIYRFLDKAGVDIKLHGHRTDQMTHKRCNRCQEVKPIDDFPINRSRKTCKRHPQCRPCRALIGQERRRHKRETDIEGVRAKGRRDASKRKLNPRYRCRAAVSHTVYNALRGRGLHKRKLAQEIGCTYRELIAHLESMFKPGMTWDNYGRWMLGQPMTWHIDHIRPIDSFDLRDPEQRLKCFHYSNLQPLWAIDNLSKGSSLDWVPRQAGSIDVR